MIYSRNFAWDEEKLATRIPWRLQQAFDGSCGGGVLAKNRTTGRGEYGKDVSDKIDLGNSLVCTSLRMAARKVIPGSFAYEAIIS